MKKLIKSKVFIITSIALVIAGLGIGAYLFDANDQKKEDEKKAQEEGKSNEDVTTEKTDNTPGEAPKPTSTGEPTPVVTPTVGELKEVSLTAYLVMEDTIASDGKTTIPAGSITPYFYLPGGIYSVQKLVGVTWQDVATSINYPGHGGLQASFAGPTEDNINYRVLKIENNTVKSISKTFVVKRADMGTGNKTYN